MLFFQVGDIARLTVCDPLRDHLLWHKRVEDISDLELTFALKRMELAHGQPKARLALEAALSECTKAYLLGDLDPVPLLQYQLPRERLLLSELSDRLRGLGQTAARATLLALHESLDPASVADLKAADAAGFHDPFSRKLLASQPRHIRFDYLFWEVVADRPRPLLNLQRRIEAEVGLSWDAFRTETGRLIIDDSDELQTFKLALFGTV